MEHQNEHRTEVRGSKGVSRIEVLDSPIGRRRWPDDLKARIVAESFQPGARVCDVAAKYGLIARHLSGWRGHLTRVEQVTEPAQRVCPCGCTDMAKIGEDRAERLDIVPARFQVIVTVRPRYACRRCDAGVIQADTPSWLIEGGLPTKGTRAHVAVSKYADHLPLCRQCRIHGRGGVDLDRSTLANWCGVAAYHLAPVVDRMLIQLRRSGRLFMPSRQIASQSPAG